jgi:hypothetical protein
MVLRMEKESSTATEGHNDECLCIGTNSNTNNTTQTMQTSTAYNQQLCLSVRNCRRRRCLRNRHRRLLMPDEGGRRWPSGGLRTLRKDEQTHHISGEECTQFRSKRRRTDCNGTQVTQTNNTINASKYCIQSATMPLGSVSSESTIKNSRTDKFNIKAQPTDCCSH